MTAASSRDRLLQRIADRSARVGVVGVGYVGLPLAAVFGAAGLRVTAIDASAERVAAINAGRSYINDVPTDVVAHLRAEGLLEATTDFRVLAELDAISICVPTPLRKTRDPDISAIVAVTEQIAQRLRPGQVIVLESTTYPGTTREVILPRLEASGLRVGTDYFLAFSPERVDPGRTDWTTRNTPKVMGGVTPACLEVARTLYETAIERVVPVSSPEVAEMVKLLENTFRAVNIGLVNEVLLMCDKLGLDVWEVIDAAATKPFGFMKFTPGPGLGGHCIPIDPLYLSWKLKMLNYTARFIDLASEVNTEMPRYWVQKVQDALNDAGRAVRGSRVLVLGVAYKRDVDDVRESPALDIIHLLYEKGALVSYHDPHVPEVQVEGRRLRCEPDLDDALRMADCVIIVTDHSAYDWRRIARQARRVVDTRGVLRHLANGQQ
ncbi:MAG: nucleotide sugar dehydrogenase [Roseiflexus sp.]|nr:nucleotide sugar dehydrogenase [Roseiflexus sp.]MDW8146459.1 nucleotide sugar dehydrogenase [Roseiflexaceae bacterium]